MVPGIRALALALATLAAATLVLIVVGGDVVAALIWLAGRPDQAACLAVLAGAAIVAAADAWRRRR